MQDQRQATDMSDNEIERIVKSVLVPHKPTYDDLAKTHADFHTRRFEQSRRSLLSELRCVTGIPELARSLKPDELYRLVLPEGRVLQKGKDGLFSGVLYGKRGRIEGHAKFTQIRPSLMKAATAVGGQVLLISIAMQLNRIEKALEDLSAELHRDRLAEILAGVDQFEKAMLFQDQTHRANAICDAVPTLHVGLQKTILELGSLIAKAPDPTSKLLDHVVPWSDKTKTAAKTMQIAEESFRASLLGIRTLAECYAEMGEAGAAAKTLSDYLEKVFSCDISAAAAKSRLVKFVGPVAPQEPWETFLKCYPAIKEDLESFRPTNALGSRSPIEIEFMPHELQGDHDGNLPEV